MKKDIENGNDIEIVMNSFYQKARADELLGPVFNSRIANDEWPAHLKRINAFWKAILFAETGFEGNPMEKHMTLPIAEKHFTRWLFLLNKPIDELYEGAKTEEAKQRADSIAQLMNFKISTQ